MKKQGILNSHISKVLADFGHTDWLVIADAGLPVPDGVMKIDLALTLGTPSFVETVTAVEKDMVIEKVIVAEEIVTANEAASSYIKDQFKETKIEYVSHESFKEMTKQAKAVIRTGEATPYANCLLQAGVIF
ncbi:D-ribose pyranase [Bacillus ectoiniformans]|uniref:D-ribose pyranase n=1 Tax=Bacillus ectoiniformans TaxID=1494429 RepID=UPI00195C8974|nr:D-ribose pyranase [Bacillus ectoiniformans]MBM7648242.1 D-ribose pyranase [Bacillus ectoiniformans]